MASPDMLEIQIHLKVLPIEQNGEQEDSETTAREISLYMRRQGYDIKAPYKGEMGLSREFVIKIVEILGDAVVAAMVKEAITEAVSEVYQHVAAFLKTRKQKQLPTTIETQVQIASGPEKQALTGQDLKPLIEEALKQAAQQHGPIKAEVSQKTTTETTVTFFIP